MSIAFSFPLPERKDGPDTYVVVWYGMVWYCILWYHMVWYASAYIHV